MNLVKLPIISPKNPIPTKFMWEEVYPNLKFRGPTRRDALHDFENAFLSRFGAEMVTKGWSFVGVSMENGGEGKSNVRKRESFWIFCFGWVRREKSFLVLNKGFSLFLLFYYKLCHMSPFEWSKKGPLSLLIVTHTQPQKWEKSDLWNA